MAIDPKKWTIKTQEAVAAAIDQARQLSNPELTPDHVMAARALGMSPWRLLARHVFPALAPLLAVSASSGFGQVLLLESGLSILGIGVPSTTASWGAVLLDVSDVIGPGRWLMIGPGLIVMSCVAAMFRVGDAMETARNAR